ncbi:MAG: prolyl oligopeptidase family serine peptidase [Gemmataceae bacterium]
MIWLVCFLLPHEEIFLHQRVDLLSQRFLDGAKSRDDWQAKLPALRREYLDMLGLWPLPPRTPLQAKVTGTVERDAVVIEKLHFQSRPRLYVTANLYRPAKVSQKLPAILYLCGHSNRGRDGNKTAFQEHGMWFATNGYVCLILDTLQLGEVPGVHHGTYNLNRFDWISRGYTPAGVECWNGIRGIDYLVSRPEVDAQRIGVTGISGGGAATVWISAADERVRVAAPVSGFSDLKSYVTDKGISRHCDCMFLMNIYGWDWATIPALIAPRPLLFANSDNDPLFPMDGHRRLMARLREAYKLHGQPEAVEEYVSKGGHDYRPDLRKRVFRFFQQHLKNEPGPVDDATAKPLPGEKLRVFPNEEDRPKDALNATIDESWFRLPRLHIPTESQFPAWKRGMLTRLRQGPFYRLPQRIAASAAGLEKLRDGTGQATLLVLYEGDDAKALLSYAAEGPVWAVRLPAIPPRKQPNTLERSHLLVGTTMDRQRVERIAAAARHLGKVQAIGQQQAAVLLAYAALFEPSIQEVIAIRPTPTHLQGPHFLGILRVMDVPTAFGLLAPRPVRLIDADKAFAVTEELAKLGKATVKRETSKP